MREEQAEERRRGSAVEKVETAVRRKSRSRKRLATVKDLFGLASCMMRTATIVQS